MGMIHVQMKGSFPPGHFEVSASEGGHANAIQRAIEWLNDRLPAAITKDHELHETGDVPPGAWFGRGGLERTADDQG